MKKRFYLFINGINTNIGDLWGWQYRAERWVEYRTDDDADCYTYHVRTTTRWLHQAEHVRKAKDLFVGWGDFDCERVLVGHSNGCEIIRRLLVDYPSLAVDYVHMVAPAVDVDFEKNGLNDALEGRVRLKQLTIHCSQSDRALKHARNTKWIRWFNSKWGYGHLGLTGPENVRSSVYNQVNTTWYEGFDHATYFIDPHFNNLMRYITGVGDGGTT